MNERKFMGFGYYEGMEKTYSDRIKELMMENEKLQQTNADLVKALYKISALTQPVHDLSMIQKIETIACEAIMKDEARRAGGGV